MLPLSWTVTGVLRKTKILRHSRDTAWASKHSREYELRRFWLIQIFTNTFTPQCLDVCYRTGVQVVTLYAFSVENFKRSKYEVGGLMEMAKVKLDQVTQHGEMLNKYGARIRVLGEHQLLPPEVQAKVNKAVGLSQHNNKAILNVCFPYTSRDEITTAIREVVKDYMQPLTKLPTSRSFSQNHIARNIRSNKLATLKEEPSSSEDNRDENPVPAQDAEPPIQGSPFSSTTTLNNSSSPNDIDSPQMAAESSSAFPDPEQITVGTLNSHMYTASNPPLDLLIRTSGVERLSDFMLWQCHEHTTIRFVDCLWPEFDLWHFLPVLVEWQWWRRKNTEAMAREAAGSRIKAS